MSLKPPYLKRIVRAPEHNSSTYPLNIELLQNGIDISFTNPVTIICGENGSGKSTILELIAAHCGYSMHGGSKNHNLNEKSSDVFPALQDMKFQWSIRATNGFFMRAESFFNFAGRIDEMAGEFGKKSLRPYGGKSLNAQSHGEAFMSLFANRFKSKGLYILDEPEAALSPAKQLEFLGVLRAIEQEERSQFIIATHSPLIMSYPGATLLVLNSGCFNERHYTRTPHFQIMRRFFDNPDEYMRSILSADS
jgi:predicted ATPase